MELILKDGKRISAQDNISAIEAVKLISEGLARNTLVIKVNDKFVSFDEKLSGECKLEAFTFADEIGRDAYRHTCSHVLAQAVRTVFPTALFAIGPAISNGF